MLPGIFRTRFRAEIPVRIPGRGPRRAVLLPWNALTLLLPPPLPLTLAQKPLVIKRLKGSPIRFSA